MMLPKAPQLGVQACQRASAHVRIVHRLMANAGAL